MQNLDVVGRLFPLILNGEKTSTIRWQENQIKTGYMSYINEDTPTQTVVVWVTKCTDMPLKDVAIYLDKEAEWSDTIMLETMREYYPKIKLDDIIQLIEHLTPVQTKAL